MRTNPFWHYVYTVLSPVTLWWTRMVRNMEYMSYTSQILLQIKWISYKIMLAKFQQDSQCNQCCMLPSQVSTTQTSSTTYLCRVCPWERWGQPLWAGRVGTSHPRSSERSLHLQFSRYSENIISLDDITKNANVLLALKFESSDFSYTFTLNSNYLTIWCGFNYSCNRDKWYLNGLLWVVST